MAKTPIKLKEELRRLGAKKLFPKTKGVQRLALTPYRIKKIKKALRDEKNSIDAQRIEHAYTDTYTNILLPTVPEIWIAGGYRNDASEPPRIIANVHPIKIHTLYKNTDAQYYSASFFAGAIHAEFVRAVDLPAYLDALVEIEKEEGQFYSQICLREGDRDMHGGAGLSNKFDSAEEFILYLSQYKRHGALINSDNTLEYVQVCYLVYEFDM